MKFIQYNLAGKVVEQYSCDFDQLKANPIGEKVRVTMDNGKICVGFWDTFLGQGKVQTPAFAAPFSMQQARKR